MAGAVARPPPQINTSPATKMGISSIVLAGLVFGALIFGVLLFDALPQRNGRQPPVGATSTHLASPAVECTDLELDALKQQVLNALLLDAKVRGLQAAEPTGKIPAQTHQQNSCTEPT